MNSRVVIEQQRLRGASQSGFLQRVGIVYLDADEYRVFAPPHATGEALGWVDHFTVHQPDKESFHSEIVSEGALAVLAIKLAKEELEKTKADSSTRRTANRKVKLRGFLNDLSRLGICGPGDDPDEQLNVVISYKYLLINIKALSRGIVSSDVYEQLEAVPSEIETIYDVYNSKPHLDAVLVDLETDLEEPTPVGHTPSRTSLIEPKLIEELKKVESTEFDTTKLTGYSEEINSSFYHGNVVACLLLMRTVLNHVPPIFGYKSFAEVTANSGKSLRENLEFLESGLRKLADLYAHQPIRKTEQYPTKGQVEPFRAHIEVLLHEVLGKLK